MQTKEIKEIKTMKTINTNRWSRRNSSSRKSYERNIGLLKFE